jgi:hypothetical protein
LSVLTSWFHEELFFVEKKSKLIHYIYDVSMINKSTLNNEDQQETYW